MKNKHWSPFEMVDLVFEINTTRDIGRQILRHRSFSFQEFSQRYASVEDLPTSELRETRLQDLKNRQSSNGYETSGLTFQEFDVINKAWEEIQTEVIDYSRERYAEALTLGIAKEQARALLPEGLTPSIMYMKGSLRSWMHYYQIRTGPETQAEHRLIAQKIKDTILNKFPSLKGVELAD